jgi:hypothetical protein
MQILADTLDIVISVKTAKIVALYCHFIQIV